MHGHVRISEPQALIPNHPDILPLAKYAFCTESTYMSEIVTCARLTPSGSGGRSAQSWWIPRLPRGVPVARHRVQEAMRGWGEPDERVETAALVVTELVANAVEHTAGRMDPVPPPADLRPRAHLRVEPRQAARTGTARPPGSRAARRSGVRDVWLGGPRPGGPRRTARHGRRLQPRVGGRGRAGSDARGRAVHAVGHPHQRVRPASSGPMSEPAGTAQASAARHSG